MSRQHETKKQDTHTHNTHEPKPGVIAFGFVVVVVVVVAVFSVKRKRECVNLALLFHNQHNEEQQKRSNSIVKRTEGTVLFLS